MLNRFSVIFDRMDCDLFQLSSTHYEIHAIISRDVLQDIFVYSHGFEERGFKHVKTITIEEASAWFDLRIINCFCGWKWLIDDTNIPFNQKYELLCPKCKSLLLRKKQYDIQHSLHSTS